jgi:hypothetical protein
MDIIDEAIPASSSPDSTAPLPVPQNWSSPFDTLAAGFASLTAYNNHPSHFPALLSKLSLLSSSPRKLLSRRESYVAALDTLAAAADSRNEANSYGLPDYVKYEQAASGSSKRARRSSAEGAAGER